MKDTKIKIIQTTTKLFAKHGYESTSMREVAKKAKIAQSVIYHHFKDKDVLLKDMFDFVNTTLGEKRKNLPETPSTSEMLKQRIIFQLDHAEEIIAVLKYFITYRKTFPKFKKGFVPPKTSLHIEEVLIRGKKDGDISVSNIEEDAKVITHAINGFLIEYYPHKPKGKEKEELVNMIHTFLMRALTKGGEIN